MKKFLYGLGGIAIVAGLVGMFTDGIFSTIAGVITAAAGGLIVLGTFVIGKAMDKNVQQNFDSGSSDNNIEIRVNHAISSARQNKFKCESEIRRLTAWCNDAIFNTYRTELEKEPVRLERDKMMQNYQNIQEKYAMTIGFEASDKCDGIVKDYTYKINGYKERIETFNKQEIEYKDLKEKLKIAKQREKRMAKLDSHQQKLEQASLKEGESIVASSDSMGQLTMSDIEREVAEKELYYKQLEELNFQYK